VDRHNDRGIADYYCRRSDGEVAEYLVSFLTHGFYKADGNVATGSFGCSTIYTQDENGTYFFGRNYDWAECETMIVHTKPENGYESVSTCCLDFLGFGDKYAPDGSMTERMQSITAIYVPLDGMNAKGLVVADLTVGDDEETYQRTGKVNLTTTTAIRLLLNKAADVDEAVALLKQYDMNSSIGISHHLSIADAHGKSMLWSMLTEKCWLAKQKWSQTIILPTAKRGALARRSRVSGTIPLRHTAGPLARRRCGTCWRV
jgi:hypothetical protein